MYSLPIEKYLPAICRSIEKNSSVIVQASPGAGKTTQIPKALSTLFSHKILVLEPRRLAAKMSAERVAFEMGEEIGGLVGYQVRFEKKISEKTKIQFITEGLFIRYLLSDIYLKDIDCLVLDEFHERHLQSDFALSVAKTLQKTIKPNLKLVVMSATLDTNELSEFLPEAEVFHCEGKVFPVTEHYLDAHLENFSLEKKVYLTIEDILKQSPNTEDHILVFLPGNKDINVCYDYLKDLTQKYSVVCLKLSADIHTQEQKKVFEKNEKRKIILATNIAETSLTIDGVAFVVDSGLANVASHDPWSGISKLQTQKISQASSIQRGGRAGRTKPGHVYKLYSKMDYSSRTRFEIPEIQRVDICSLLLETKMIEESLLTSSPGLTAGPKQNPLDSRLRGNDKMRPSYRDEVLSSPGLTAGPKQNPLDSRLRGNDINKTHNDNVIIQWFDKPKNSQIENSEKLLYWLGFLNEKNTLTAQTKNLSKTNFALHPRLLAIIDFAKQSPKELPSTLLLVSLLSEGSFFHNNFEQTEATHSDIFLHLSLLKKIHDKKELSYQEKKSIDLNHVQKINRLCEMLCQTYQLNTRTCYENLLNNEDFISQSLLKSFPDRIAKARLASKNLSYLLCLGGEAILSKQSSVHDENYLIVLEADLSHTQIPKIRVCHGINENLLLGFAHENFLNERFEVQWDKQKQVVKQQEIIGYGLLNIEETILHKWTSAVSELLFKELKNAWPVPFNDDSFLYTFNVRLDFYIKLFGEINIEPLTGKNFDLF